MSTMTERRHGIHDERTDKTRPGLIVIEQLDDEGETFRQFEREPRTVEDLTVRLGLISRSFDMSRTRVTIID